MDTLFSKNWWKSLLTEAKLPAKKRKEVIKNFLIFAKKELGLKKLPKISFTSDSKIPQENRSLGFYEAENRTISVYIKNRNLADILRTLGHELVHEKQKEEGRIKPNSGETGSEIENEANSKAGVMMRKFGKLYPEIYE